MAYLARWQHLLFPIGIIACLLVMLVPLPAALLDLLLAGNLAVAVVILLTTLYIKKPLEFSVFPSLLLATTLSRLVMNVASTRLILTRAETARLDAAGHVIRAFGEFVTGNHILVGLIIFAIIIAIQFLVITKGATRISEVAARFSLDGMPGRQMAIDADLHAGTIDEKEAQRRRAEVSEQADFYGAMDGASKFVRGDAIAGIVITMINIVGGLAIGVVEAGMSITQAAELFTKLTVGDGLVSQTPAFLISLAAAMLVTRSSQSVNLPREILKQMFSRPEVLAVAAIFLGVLVFTRLPALPLLFVAGILTTVAISVSRSSSAPVEKADDKTENSPQHPSAADKRIEDFLAIDPMEMELGVGLIRLADPNRGGDLLTQVTEVRKRVAAELGIVLPKVRIRDNMRLAQRQYRIKLAGDPVAEGTAYPNKLFAVVHGSAGDGLPGVPAEDPATDRPAYWVGPDQLRQAQQLGYTVIDPTAVLARHLQQVVRDHAAELLTRDATKHLIDELRKTSPAVIDELIPSLMKLGDVQQVLQALLREGIPIRQLGSILEALGDRATTTTDTDELTQYVRERLARTISTQYRGPDRRLRVVTFSREFEQSVVEVLEKLDGDLPLHFSSPAVEEINREVRLAADRLVREGGSPIILVSRKIRAGLKRLTAGTMPHLVVLSREEITADTMIEAMEAESQMMTTAA